MSVAAANRALARMDRVDERVLRLARVLSPAVRIERPLLRDARLELTPDLDAGVESDLWFSPLVGSRSATAVVLDAGVAARLRAELAASEQLFRSARRVIERAHAAALPEIQVEEELIYLSLLPPREGDGALEARLTSALRTLVDDRSRSLEVARWADRAICGLPERARRLARTRELAVGALARLGPAARVLPVLEEFGLPDGVRWVLPDAGAEQLMEVGIRVSDERIEVVDLKEPGAWAVSVPVCAPVVWLSWKDRKGQHKQTIAAFPGRGVAVASRPKVWEVRTATGAEYRFAPLADSRDVPLPTSMDWVLDVLHSLASAFHDGSFEAQEEPLASEELWRFYKLGSEEEANDFTHIRDLLGGFFAGPVRDFLAGSDPFDPPEHVLRESLDDMITGAASAAIARQSDPGEGEEGGNDLHEGTLAGARGNDTGRLLRLLNRVQVRASKLELQSLDEALGRSLDEELAILRGVVADRRSRRREHMEDPVAVLGGRLGEAAREILLSYVHPLDAVLGVPSTLDDRLDFPAYASGVLSLWVAYLGAAERRRGSDATVHVHTPISVRALGMMAEDFPEIVSQVRWIELGENLGYEAVMSFPAYRRAATTFFELVRRRLTQVAREGPDTL